MSLLETLLPPVELVGPDGIERPFRMRPEEQLAVAALGLANLIVSIGLIVVLPSRTAGAGKRHDLLILLALSIVASLGSVVSARLGRRVVAAIVVLAAGALGPGVALSMLFVIPHYGVAFWMMMRQNKLMKAQTMLRRQQRQEGTKPGATPAQRRSRREPPKLPDGRPAPPASKRYTPPRPKKRPVPVPDDKAKAKAKAERQANGT